MMLISASSENAGCGDKETADTPALKAAAVFKKLRRLGAHGDGNIATSLLDAVGKRKPRDSTTMPPPTIRPGGFEQVRLRPSGSGIVARTEHRARPRSGPKPGRNQSAEEAKTVPTPRVHPVEKSLQTDEETFPSGLEPGTPPLPSGKGESGSRQLLSRSAPRLPRSGEIRLPPKSPLRCTSAPAKSDKNRGTSPAEERRGSSPTNAEPGVIRGSR